MKRLAMLIIGGAVSFVAVFLLNVALIEVWKELGLSDLKGGMIRIYGLALMMMVIFGAVIFANFMEKPVQERIADLKPSRLDLRSTTNTNDDSEDVVGLEQLAQFVGDVSSRVKTAVDNMNDVQKIAVVGVLVMPFLFSKEWRYLTNFYKHWSDFDDYSALLGAWLVCATVYYLWRPKTPTDHL